MLACATFLVFLFYSNVLFFPVDTSLKVFNDNLAAATAKSTAISSSCDPATSHILSDRFVIDYNAVRSMTKDRWSQLKGFTAEGYDKYGMEPPGKEHYSFMEYLVQTFDPVEGWPCKDTDNRKRRHVVDIGTRYVTSALALGGAHGAPIKTFDLPESKERFHAFRGKTEDEWQRLVRDLGVNITFYNVDLIKLPDDEFKAYMSTWLISLDTHHLPYTVPFEREFFARLLQHNYQGVLVLDDIHLNDEMKKWWTEVKENADANNYRCFDVTAIGHYSGTGLVDFSGKVELLGQ